MAVVLPEKSEAATTSGAALRVGQDHHVRELGPDILNVLNCELVVHFTRPGQPMS